MNNYGYKNSSKNSMNSWQNEVCRLLTCFMAKVPFLQYKECRKYAKTQTGKCQECINIYFESFDQLQNLYCNKPDCLPKKCIECEYTIHQVEKTTEFKEYKWNGKRLEEYSGVDD